jgi:hypothetical protein
LVQADLREEEQVPLGPFDAILCLYDVVGSSADPADDQRLLQNLRSRLPAGGLLVLSVMSAEGTLQGLPPGHRPESEEQFVEALEHLAPSRQMETSGSVFDPRYIVVYENRYYRKEQFDAADDLPPSELIIRDRRFTAAEIADVLQRCGFEVLEIAGVRAGAWREALAADDPTARELLVLARGR